MRDNRSRDNEGRLYFFFKEQKKNMAKYLYKTSVATLMHDTLSTHSEMVSSSNKFGKQNNQKKKKKKKKGGLYSSLANQFYLKNVPW